MFIIVDYLFFLLGVGRYSVKEIRKRYPINLSWEGDYEPVLEDILLPGDCVFFASDNSFISWLVRYFTKSDISHIGLYIGRGEVFHATLSGTRIDRLKDFFGHGCHVIPVRAPVAESKRKMERKEFEKLEGKSYTLGRVVIRTSFYLMGYPWRKFRLTYFFDVGVFLAAISFLFFDGEALLVFLILYLPYLSFVLFFFTARKKLRVPIADPGEGFLNLPKGFSTIPNVKKMNEKWFLDMLPKDIANGKE